MKNIRLIVASLALLIASSLSAGYKPVRNVAIVIYNGVEVLDFAGPAEVFESAGHFGAENGDHSKRAFKMYTVALTKDPIVSQRFLKIVPDYSIADAPQPDVIVLPGGGTQEVLQSEAFMKWATEAMKKSEVTLTVCTGAFIAAKSGFADDRDITTWYDAVERLRTEAKNSRVHAGRRYIDSGNLVTTAGVSAGIDGSLHVVARLLGRQVADQTARYMEYRWAPEPYLATEYSYLNPSLNESGRLHQQASIAADEKNWSAAEDAYRKILAKDDSNASAWFQLGRVYLGAKKAGQAAAAYEKAAQSDAFRTSALYNAACAYAMKNDNTRAIDFLGRAIDAGMKNKDYLLSDPDLASLRSDARFQQLISKL